MSEINYGIKIVVRAKNRLYIVIPVIVFDSIWDVILETDRSNQKQTLIINSRLFIIAMNELFKVCLGKNKEHQVDNLLNFVGIPACEMLRIMEGVNIQPSPKPVMININVCDGVIERLCGSRMEMYFPVSVFFYQAFVCLTRMDELPANYSTYLTNFLENWNAVISLLKEKTKNK